jgi:CheY-like chemotaxis protein
MGFARRQELHPTLVDPAAVLSEAEDMICHTVGSRIGCRFGLSEEIWPVLVDPVRLETVLLNLVANARDALPRGGEVVVAARNAEAGELPPELPSDQEYVRISVTDNGEGMSAETLRRAAEPFFTTKPLGKGTGLGLASAHGFAAQSGGALRLSSTPGKGTQVEIFLPRAAVLPADEDPDEAPAQPPGAAKEGEASILVVDDDDSVRPVTAALLRDLGYRVIEAPSAEAAEALMHAETEIDMLVTDVVMPGAPGHVLARRLRAERPGLPVLYITGHAGSARLDDAPVLRKPFTDAALARAIHNGLGRRSRIS